MQHLGLHTNQPLYNGWYTVKQKRLQSTVRSELDYLASSTSLRALNKLDKVVDSDHCLIYALIDTIHLNYSDRALDLKYSRVVKQ